MNVEYEQLKTRYWLCRTGFGLIALAIGLLGIDVACNLVLAVSGNGPIAQMLNSSFWTWGIGAPITWASLLGSYLLWGRWTEPIWQRRVGLLVLMNFFDLITWFMHHAQEFGSMPAAGLAEEHSWLIGNVTRLLGWAEILLIGDLATDLILHFTDKDSPPEISRASHTLSIVGLILAGMLFVTQTDWGFWPLHRIQLNPSYILMTLGSLLLMTMTSFQVTTLCVMAARRCSQYLQDVSRYEIDQDPLKSRSESEDAWK